MRDWNHWEGKYYRAEYWVCWVPMRDWNALSTFSFSCPFLMFVGCLWGIETDILKLKQGNTKVFVGCLWGIETQWKDSAPSELVEKSLLGAYEGLKLCKNRKQKLYHLLFVGCLWGIETFLFCVFLSIYFMFVGCLWGIETKSSFPWSIYLKLFVGCLWGIETSKNIYTHNTDIRLLGAYEGLKRILTICIIYHL